MKKKRDCERTGAEVTGNSKGKRESWKKKKLLVGVGGSGTLKNISTNKRRRRKEHEALETQAVRGEQKGRKDQSKK